MKNNNNFLDDPELWAKAGKWLFVLAVIYYGWSYIVTFLAVCGAYFLWREWNRSNRDS